MRRLALLALLSALLTPHAVADLIIGQVVDAQGVGVPGVNIDVEDMIAGDDPDVFNGGTDANGFFSTTVDPGGTYDIIFIPPKPPTTTLLIERLSDVTVAGTLDLGVIQMEQGVALSGRCIDDLGQPVVNVNLDLIDTSTGENLDITGDNSDLLGNFLLAAPLGSIDVLFDTAPVQGSLLAPTSRSLDTSLGSALGDVVFEPGFLMTALVRGPGGQALENVDTDVFDSSTGAQLYTPSDNTDDFGLVDVVVPAGTFDFKVCPQVASQLVVEEVPGVVVAANTNLGLINVSAGVILSGTVLDDQGAPASGVDVDAHDATSGMSVPFCQDNTNAAGQYAVVVPTGSYDVTFEPAYSQPLGSQEQLGVPVLANTVLDGVLPACPFHTAYGVGLAGSGGVVPLLGSSGGAPRLGNPNWTLELSQGLGGTTAALILGLAPSALPFKQGTVLVDIIVLPSVILFVPLFGTPGVAGTGVLSLPLAVSTDPALAGLSTFWQFLAQDPGAPVGWSMSNGVQVTYCE